MKQLAILVSLAILFWGMSVSADNTFTELLAKNRSKIDTEFHKGRVEFHSNHIRNYRDQDNVSDKQMGNIATDAKVVYNYTVITAPLVKTFKERFHIGTVTAEGKYQTITNITELHGTIKSFHSTTTEIGVVILKEEKAEITNIVTIDGSLYVH